MVLGVPRGKVLGVETLIDPLGHQLTEQAGDITLRQLFVAVPAVLLVAKVMINIDNVCSHFCDPRIDEREVFPH